MAVDLSTYGGFTLTAGYAGQIVDGNPTTIESKTNDQTAIDFGVAVARSAADGTCKAPTADGDKIIGISVRLATKVADSSGNVTYARYDAVPVLKDGYIYAVAYENATRGDGVISVTAQNGNWVPPLAALLALAAWAVPGAVWETTVTAGNVGIVRIAS